MSSEPAPERIVVSYNLTAGEYADYAAAIARRSRSWTAFNISLAVLFSAIPVALLFRWLAAQRIDDPAVIEMAGEYSLYSFGLAIIISWITSTLLTWIVRRRYFRTTVNAVTEPRTAELDRTGITISSKGARVSYDWTIATHCRLEQRLLMIWVAPATAAAIPTRSFGDEAACKAALAFVRARVAEAKAKPAQDAADATKPASV